MTKKTKWQDKLEQLLIEIKCGDTWEIDVKKLKFFITSLLSHSYTKGREKGLEQAKAIFVKHKDQPMTGNVVLLELDVLLDTLKGKEKV